MRNGRRCNNPLQGRFRKHLGISGRATDHRKGWQRCFGKEFTEVGATGRLLNFLSPESRVGKWDWGGYWVTGNQSKGDGSKVAFPEKENGSVSVKP